MDIEQALSEAETHIRQNQTAQARKILGEIIRAAPQNEEAWILSAQVSDKPEQVRYCLQRAIAINPTSSRARLLLDRLQQPQVPEPSISSSQPEPDTQSDLVTQPEPVTQSEPDTLPQEDLLSSVAMADGTATIGPNPQNQNMEPAGNTTGTQVGAPEVPAVPAQTVPVPSDTTAKDTGGAIRTAAQSARPGKKRKRPTRWLQRAFIIAATACLWAPWILMQDGSNAPRTLTGAQILLQSYSSISPDVVIASLAALALLVLMFFRFKSAATQKWGERAAIALVPLAALPSLDLISSYYAGSNGILALRWGVWLNCAFYLLIGLAALINARRLGNLGRSELSTAPAGRVFTWLFTLGDILAFLWIEIVFKFSGKLPNIGTAFPSFILLFLGALLSLFV
jgi:hypothetical protein